MRLEWYIAQRYLTGAHRGRALISTAGVIVGVTVLIVVISVMNGFERDFMGKLLGVYGHLKLYLVEGDRVVEGLPDYEQWIARFRTQPGVAGISPFIESGVMVVADPLGNGDTRAQYIQARGIDPRLEGDASDLIKARLAGDWTALASKPQVISESQTNLVDPFTVQSETPGIFLGIELARSLFVDVAGRNWSEKDPGFEKFVQNRILGQKVKLVAPRVDRGPAGMQLFFIELEVKGLFKTGFFDIDLQSGLVSLDTARVLKGMPAGKNLVECLEVRLKNPDPQCTTESANRLVEYALDNHDVLFHPSAWMSLNPILLKAIETEKVVMGSILALVVLVAAFGIASTLVMTVLEKTREIGTLMAMGTRRRSIMAIFVLNGFQVGILGTFLGILVGLGLCWMVAVLQIPMPGGGSVYVLDVLPVEIRWLDVTLISLLSISASTLAGVYPAWKAAKLQPVEALSYE